MVVLLSQFNTFSAKSTPILQLSRSTPQSAQNDLTCTNLHTEWYWYLTVEMRDYYRVCVCRGRGIHNMGETEYGVLIYRKEAGQ